MIAVMQLQENAPGRQTATANKETSLQFCKCCNKQTIHQDEDFYYLDRNKDKRHQWYIDIMEKRAKAKTNKTKKNE